MPTLVYRKHGRPTAYVFGVQDAPITIGRSVDCMIVIDEVNVSRRHAEIVTDDDGLSWCVHDLGSANGTFVNDARIETRCLGDQDILTCGTVALEFRRGPSSGRVDITREGSSPQKRRYTPIPPVRVGENTFEVQEAEDWVATIGDANADPNKNMLMHRIRALEERNRVLEQELFRLHEAMLRAGTGVSPSTAHRDDDSGDGAGRIPASVVSAMSNKTDVERRTNAIMDRLFDRVSHGEEHGKDTSGEDE